MRLYAKGKRQGGHRGSFASAEDPLYSLATLLSLTQEVVHVPLIAAGGIMNGKGAKSLFALGASSVQLGTAFLPVHESGAHPLYKRALLERKNPTVLTKAFTGKWARAIDNEFCRALASCEVPPYPQQHFLTKELRAKALQEGNPEFAALWAGQGYPLCRSMRAAELVQEIIA